MWSSAGVSRPRRKCGASEASSSSRVQHLHRRAPMCSSTEAGFIPNIGKLRFLLVYYQIYFQNCQKLWLARLRLSVFVRLTKAALEKRSATRWDTRTVFWRLFLEFSHHNFYKLTFDYVSKRHSIWVRIPYVSSLKTSVRSITIDFSKRTIFKLYHNLSCLSKRRTKTICHNF